ncbi:phage tail protein [Gordonibacter sp.]|uniref:phage tail protein n=1 Tax=Gordonibacter sp. TaxID=1968902 RepID=UPI002FCA4763
MAGPLRQIIEVPCAVDTLPYRDILRQLEADKLVALGVNPEAVAAHGTDSPGIEGAADLAVRNETTGSGTSEPDNQGSVGKNDAAEPELAEEIELNAGARQRLDAAIAACLAAYEPRGVFKIFNPTICTLPPKYTEPAIKLVGTMMIFRGKSVYDRLRRSVHCALLAATIGPESPAALPAAPDDLDRALARACARALVECAADRVNASIIAAAADEGLYTDDRLRPGDGDFPLDSRSQLVFYTQSEKRLGLKLDVDGALDPPYSTMSVVGLYDPSQKGRRRACGRCKHRDYCTIRAIGMNCHGSKGSFPAS